MCMARAVAVLLLLSVVASHARDVTCDVVVAGGSTASLAAAITAAEADAQLTVCFTEITDWPGGQMTAGGVPAIDFGGGNSNGSPDNQPASFRWAPQARERRRPLNSSCITTESSSQQISNFVKSPSISSHLTVSHQHQVSAILQSPHISLQKSQSAPGEEGHPVSVVSGSPIDEIELRSRQKIRLEPWEALEWLLTALGRLLGCTWRLLCSSGVLLGCPGGPKIDSS